MTTPEDVLALARADLGYTEAAVNWTKFGAFYGTNGIPWSAAALSLWFHDAGLPLPARTPKGFAWCQDGLSWFHRQGRFDLRPRVGDVVFYQFDSDAAADHAGIVECVGDGYIVAIEGDTNHAGHPNGGTVLRRRRPLALVLGFGHPPYDPDPSTARRPHRTTDRIRRLLPAPRRHAHLSGSFYVLVMTSPNMLHLAVPP